MTCAQRRLSSAWAPAQSDHSHRCAHEERLDPVHGEDWSDWVDAQADLGLHWAHVILHLPSLITVIAVRMKKDWIQCTAKTDQTGWMPRLIWVFTGHTSFCWFCRAPAQIKANCIPGPVHRAYHNLPFISFLWLKYCWKCHKQIFITVNNH